jgi:hypothetical protein
MWIELVQVFLPILVAVLAGCVMGYRWGHKDAKEELQSR